MKVKRSIALMLACWSFVNAQSAAEPMFAVMPFTSRSVDLDALEGIGSALSSELLKTGKVRVMERDQMETILKEQSFQNSGACDGGDCAVEIGKLLSVDRMIVGNIARVGNTYSVTARLVRVESGEVIRSVTHNTRAEVDAILIDIVPVVARELAEPQRSEKTAQGQAPAMVGADGRSAPLEPLAPTESVEGKRPVWPWIVGGVAILGGSAAAVFLLTQSESSSAAQPPAATDPGDGSWDTIVRWK